MSRSRSLLAALMLVVAAGAACSRAEDPTEESTHRSLVAAVAEHLDRPAKRAAPLYPSDYMIKRVYGRSKRYADTLAVEVAFDEEVGDNSHVDLVITPDLSIWDQFPCPSDDQVFSGCLETVTADGAEQRLRWDEVAPEEDPGYIAVSVRHDDRVVSTSYWGQEVPLELLESDLAEIADALVALASDPAVGLMTTPTYVEAGEAIDDDVMLDWYGQYNGSPPPSEVKGEQ